MGIATRVLTVPLPVHITYCSVVHRWSVRSQRIDILTARHWHAHRAIVSPKLVEERHIMSISPKLKEWTFALPHHASLLSHRGNRSSGIQRTPAPSRIGILDDTRRLVTVNQEAGGTISAVIASAYGLYSMGKQ